MIGLSSNEVEGSFDILLYPFCRISSCMFSIHLSIRLLHVRHLWSFWCARKRSTKPESQGAMYPFPNRNNGSGGLFSWFSLDKVFGQAHWLPSPGKQERKMRDVLCNTDVYYVRRSIYLYTRLASSGPLIASTCYSSSIWVIKSLLPKYWEICAAAPICPIIGHGKGSYIQG